jgi:hypothetical protein
MPGRRYSPRSEQEKKFTHVQSVFPGGLNGASMSPYPVGRKSPQDASSGGCPQTLFFNEEFAVSGGAQTVSLTFLPLPQSEHVYLCRGLYGTYQREKIAWTREGGSRTVNVLTAMGAQAGDTIVVEYAHYEQALKAVDEPIWWTLDSIVPEGFYEGVVKNQGTIGALGDGTVYYEVSPAPPLVAGSNGAIEFPVWTEIDSESLSAISVLPGASSSTAAMEYYVSAAVSFGSYSQATWTRVMMTVMSATYSSRRFLRVGQSPDGTQIVLESSLLASPFPVVGVPAAPGDVHIIEALVKVDPCWGVNAIGSTVTRTLTVDGTTVTDSSVIDNNLHAPYPDGIRVILGNDGWTGTESSVIIDEFRAGWRGTYTECP